MLPAPPARAPRRAGVHHAILLLVVLAPALATADGDIPLRPKLTQVISDARVPNATAEQAFTITPEGRAFVVGQQASTLRPALWTLEPGSLTSTFRDLSASFAPSSPSSVILAGVGYSDERHAIVLGGAANTYRLIYHDITTDSRRSYCAWSGGGSPLPYYLLQERGTSYLRGNSAVLCHTSDEGTTPFYTWPASPPIRPITAHMGDVYELAFLNGRAEVRRRGPGATNGLRYSVPIPGTEGCGPNAWQPIGGHTAHGPDRRMFVLVVFEACGQPNPRLHYEIFQYDDLSVTEQAHYVSESFHGPGGLDARLLPRFVGPSVSQGLYVVIDRPHGPIVQYVYADHDAAAGTYSLERGFPLVIDPGRELVRIAGATLDSAGRLILAGDTWEDFPLPVAPIHDTWVTIVDGDPFVSTAYRVEPGSTATDRTIAVTVDAQDEVHVLARRGNDLHLFEYWNDSDGDGLLDTWETQGFDIDGDGIDEIDLPAMGADPNRKDLFLWVDAMQGTASTVQLGLIFGHLQATFDSATSVTSPNGAPGINLHIVVGRTDVPSADWPDFSSIYPIRQVSFAGAATGTAATHLIAARKHVFRYALFASGVVGLDDRCGQASAIPGAALAVYWNAPGCARARTRDLQDYPQSTIDILAWTTLHELGHLMGLGHGGADRHIKSKPNYHSVMDVSDMITTSGRMQPGGGFAATYSDVAGATIDESSVVEQAGAGLPAAHAAHATVTHYIGLSGFPTDELAFNYESGPADFDNDGRIDSTPKIIDLNGDWLIQELRGYNDWDLFDYRLYDTPGWSDETAAELESPLSEALSFVGRCDIDAAPGCFCDVPDERRACSTNVGRCVAGIQTCTDGDWGVCVGAVKPRPERCDNTDDDCDGRTDEDYADLGTSCVAGIGACYRDGTMVCNAAEDGVVCSVSAGSPTTELCGTGVDEDCDGQTDEGFASVGQSCSAGVGACLRSGTIVCSADRLSATCSVVAGTPVSEICGNGLDEDCDGIVDQGCAPQLVFPWANYKTGSGRAGTTPHFRDPVRPTFRWTALANASYQLQVDDDSAFGTPALDATTTQTSYRPNAPLPWRTSAPMGTRYLWRVRATVAGVVGPWSAARRVEVGRFANDLNGDDYGDLAVGTIESTPAYREGNVHVFHGAPDQWVYGVAPTRTLQWPVHQAQARFGTALAMGDINGDGYGDLIVGAPGRNIGGLSEVGEVDVYLGSATGIGSTVSYSIQPPVPQAGMHFGTALARVDDGDGDGVDDLWIGAPDLDLQIWYNGRFTEQPDVGAAYLYAGASSGVAQFVMRLRGADLRQHFGGALAQLGDVDDNGIADLAIGAPGTNGGVGAVMVFLRGSDQVIDQVILPTTGNSAAAFGGALAVGDFDNDGAEDLAIARAAVWNVSTAGVDVHREQGTTFATTATWRFELDAGDVIGPAIAAGDGDRDGFADLAVGRPIAGVGGRIELYRGSASGLTFTNSYDGTEAGAGLGSSVQWIDGDGDGALDLVAGAPWSDSPTTDEGRVFVWKRWGASTTLTAPSRMIDSPAGRASGLFGLVVR